MYVYHEYFDARRVALVYPGSKSSETKGTFFPTPTNDKKDRPCFVISFAIPDNPENGKSIVSLWQERISSAFDHWFSEIVD